MFALFDWDNTVRSGVTLFSWMDFLCDKKIITGDQKNYVWEIKRQYIKKQITHDQYAEMACARYASIMEGVSENDVASILPDYVNYEKQFLFSNLKSLFDAIYRKGIEIIVISGAPLRIISQYAEVFHLNRIFAFKEQIVDGVYSGEVEYNYGFEKYKVVQKLVNEYQAFPFLAFGDSYSDLPMLNSAVHSYCIGDGLKDFKNILIADNRIPDSILNEIASL